MKKNKIRLPYGISNYATIREENYLYVDKTKYIEILEEKPPFQFFIRPRRFGKSLFISVLEHYYDIKKKDKFEELFGDLYIGKNPTEKRNSYLVLRLSFAAIVTNQGKKRLIESFDMEVTTKIDGCIYAYQNILGESKLPKDIKGAEGAIIYLVNLVKKANYKIFLLIDEYDNFANDLIAQENKELYYELLESEGYVRAFYKALKEGSTSVIPRIFMTGVSPIMLDDLTSGFNITTNLTTEEFTNEMMGITEEELDKILTIIDTKDFTIEELKKDMKYFYNGYLFSKKANKRLYNTDMVLYFLNAINDGGSYPDEILDNNVKTDYRKIKTLAFNFEDKEAIDKLLLKGSINEELVDRFHIEVMYSEKKNFISLLFYMGMLTIEKPLLDEISFCIPNEVVKTIYWDYFIDMLKTEFDDIEINVKEYRKAIRDMALEGKIDRFIDKVSYLLMGLSNRDLNKFDEKYVKMIMLLIQSMSSIYKPISEREVSKGYIDLLFLKNKKYEDQIKYEWLVELKYLKESERNELEKYRDKGLEQLRKYKGSEDILKGHDENSLKKVLIIAVGKKDIYKYEIK